MREKAEQYVERVVFRAIRLTAFSFPFIGRDRQLAFILAKIVIDNRQRDTAFEVCKVEPRTVCGQILTPIRDGTPGLARQGAQHRIHFAEKPFDNESTAKCGAIMQPFRFLTKISAPDAIARTWCAACHRAPEFGFEA